MFLMSCRRFSSSTIQNVSNLPDDKTTNEHLNPQIVEGNISNTRIFHLLDDLPIEIFSRIIVIAGLESAKDSISRRLCVYKILKFKEDVCSGGDPQVFRTTSLHMIEVMGPKHPNVDLFIRTCAFHNNIEAMFRQGMVECFSNGNFEVGVPLLKEAAVTPRKPEAETFPGLTPR
uniref:At2g35280-like TPR domain-containing protein n=1 Tax=Lactuca sativa TaxID=4236 RepID=A0A9R1W1U9_LACSA|nr:hypothetical protein LSAT_V11C300136450 [Lactuca sativa]